MRTFFVVIGLFLFSWSVYGQPKTIPPVERRVTINRQNETIEAILTEVGHQADFTFSYSPKTIDVSKRLSLSVEKQTVRLVLNQLFEGTVSYREKGKFVILQPRKSQQNAPVIVEGYLTDMQGELLTDVTVYNASNKEATISNDYGYFRLELAPKNLPDTLKICKQGFEDALLMPAPGTPTFVTLTLPKEDRGYAALETQTSFFPSLLVKHELQVNSNNVKETFGRVFQLSLLPHLGTNNLLSGKSSNLISVNILGGYVESVRAFEAGTIMNIVRRNAWGLQASGVGNFVGGDFKGLQAAGVVNLTQGNGYGLQAAGVFNNNRGDCSGLQAAGIMNNVHRVVGCQTAGVFNLAREANGAQIAGVTNYLQYGTGVQLSGVLNVADTLNGVQVSGLINKAKYFKGVQLGIVNIADSCSGAQIGMVNICKKGYHQLEVYSTETFYTNIAYRGGTRSFFSTLMGGYDPRTIGSTPLYTVGIGFGTSFGKSPRWNYDADLMFQQVYQGQTAGDINMLYRLGFGVNYAIARKIAFTLGLTYNFYLVDSSIPEYATTFSHLSPYFISNESVGLNRNLKTWIGLKAGIRLF